MSFNDLDVSGASGAHESFFASCFLERRLITGVTLGIFLPVNQKQPTAGLCPSSHPALLPSLGLTQPQVSAGGAATLPLPAPAQLKLKINHQTS